MRTCSMCFYSFSGNICPHCGKVYNDTNGEGDIERVKSLINDKKTLKDHLDRVDTEIKCLNQKIKNRPESKVISILTHKSKKGGPLI